MDAEIRREVRAHPRNNSAFLGGIVATGLGGGFAFMGGMLALAGGVSDRSGLVTAGAITAGVGLVAVGPGVWLLVSSGSHAEVLLDGAPAVATPRTLDMRAAF